ncbi:MAG: hypothetical protein K2L07_10985 [Lachnospiraceae bacterium]|nr:hypothetical protein [Lachnospiraceae bacterium]
MASFKIHTSVVKGQCETLSANEKTLFSYSSRVSEISAALSLGDSTEKIQQSLKVVCDNLNKESREFALLASKLEEIVGQYKMAESQIIEKDVKVKDSNNEKTKNDLPDSKEDSSSEDSAMEELIWTILGFIPGLNCIADIRQIVKDFEKAAADGKLSNSEIIAIIMDFAFLVMDTVSLLALVRNITKGVKAAKLASTAAKTAEQKAVAAAKTAEKAASKTGGTVTKTRAAQKAVKTAKAAEKAAAKAETAKAAASAAKKEAAKEAAKSAAKDTGKNIVNKYLPTKDNHNVPGKVLEDTKDILLDEGA